MPLISQGVVQPCECLVSLLGWDSYRLGHPAGGGGELKVEGIKTGREGHGRRMFD